ncbi:Oligopeptide transporter, periplasmic-binding protein [Bacillus cereus 95/8201]|uniref:peptide ABC transporter substrate-binding protein n=1 Tax=Bacillus cereus group TaxID=86661 RepID=UPI0001A08E3F|nr:peptide ABC transporter substrate-binding protein [Bacillus cereus]AJH63408.1 bacterial extracellular solute-binding s, 5 Middle family protein [Bacillus cereus]AJK34857.1 bacterial extracellular solute-binding s, 5 Middle family protein [Bacillus cereus]EEL19183.1 Oligopeptide transporter, periplasmic-binding protein [Bacillus cereus 95/8201]KWU59657.1 peptide ABC transporter substrate-binding protein [Bacillus cereus]MDA1817177.1 peptide ABC transporter substrate-binding protein [Bacillus
MKKKFVPGIASVVGVSILLTGCGSYKNEASGANAKDEAPSKQVLNLSSPTEIRTMDTARATDTDSGQVMRNVFEGLYNLGEGNKPVPGVAKSHEVSGDKTKYTFHLRDSKWSNGTPVTAKDFVFAWQRAVDPATASEYAFLFFDIKNATKINNKELPADQLGVKAVDDHTFEVELERPVPYFISLTAFPTFLPINEEFFKAQGDKYALEDNTILYNGAFTLSDWKHEQSFKFKKNPTYWDKDTVKLEEINFNVVKEKSTEVNLFESKQLDRIKLTSDFVDKYKKDANFKERPNVGVQFLRMNQQNKVLQNVSARQAIDQTIDRKSFVNTLLNDGSTPTFGLVPKNFAKGPDGKDFRTINGDLTKVDTKSAQELWKKAKQELGSEKITLELLTSDADLDKKTGEFLKGQLEKNLDGLTVNVKPQPRKQQVSLLLKGDYEIGIDGWSPDFADPITFLELFKTNNPYNLDHYSNKEFDKTIEKVKTTLAGDEKARWEALLASEKILFKDSVIAPLYQKGESYLERSYVKGIVQVDFAGQLNFKWAQIEK